MALSDLIDSASEQQLRAWAFAESRFYTEADEEKARKQRAEYARQELAMRAERRRAASRRCYWS